MNHYKKLAETMPKAEIETIRIYSNYYRGTITAAEQEKMLATIIKNSVNNELIISSMFSIIASRPAFNNYKETIESIFSSELKNYVERLETIRRERELYELQQSLAG